MQKLFSCIAGIGSLLSCQTQKTGEPAALPPNIIFIYADDLGRGLLSCQGQKIIKTPNIDLLAARGVRFKNIRGCMFSAPARASLLTGYHDCRGDKWKITAGGAYFKVSTENIAPEEISAKLVKQIGGVRTDIMTMAELFKKGGYTTGQIGKLEWGFSETLEAMNAHGWDYYYGYLDHVMCHGYYPPFMIENGKKINITGNTRADCGVTTEGETKETYRERWNMAGRSLYSQNLFIQKIIDFLNKNKDKPFFLYHPTQLPHGPVAIPKVDPDFINDSRLTQIEKEYASMVKLLDDHVGIILKVLEKLNLVNRTMIIFSSDNGHEIYYSMEGRITYPVRNMRTGELFDNITTKFYSDIGGDVFNGNDGMAGLKFSNWEGGLRVPLIVRWPGKIPEGRVYNNLVANYDLWPTFAELINVKTKEHKDGISLLPLLLGKDETIEHQYVVNSSYMGATLITKDGWKLRHFFLKDIFQLYYLPEDYREEHNLSEKYQDKVEQLKNILFKECNGNFKNGFFSNDKDILPAVN